ncbi:thiamine phosphate synthase [Helicobacter salomonis]|uniref:thiamine phosphate synthase n=1 Tax=Helicobacter salomonis TaxID=56878 RepID=UPI000CF070D5|nr:thiamine phosphate synthase [Helicobacter salomonis]
MNLESYCITPSFFSTLNPWDFKIALSRILRTHHPTRACLRATHASDTLLACFVSTCQEFGVITYINLAHLQISIQKALEHGFMGVHAKGSALGELKIIPPTLSSFYSAHGVSEVQEALEEGAHFITLSPIFSTPNKPPPLGLDYFKTLSPALKSHVFALGGITSQNRELLDNLNIRGFAGIQYFLNTIQTT